MKLEELQPDATFRGILPDAVVTVVNVNWHAKTTWRFHMKPDRYTKIVLTIIAACLVALTVRSTQSDVRAQSGFRCRGELSGSGASNPSYDVDVTCK